MVQDFLRPQCVCMCQGTSSLRPLRSDTRTVSGGKEDMAEGTQRKLSQDLLNPGAL